VLWRTVNNYTIDEPVAGVQGVYVVTSAFISYSIPVPVTLYQCNLLGPDCTSCLAQQGTKFNCVYCPESNCVFHTRCGGSPFGSCPAPMINAVCYECSTLLCMRVVDNCSMMMEISYHTCIAYRRGRYVCFFITCGC